MDCFVNPYTRDYQLAKGPGADLVRDPAAGLANAAYLRLATPLGEYWAAPDMGSKLHTLAREKDVPRVRVLARQYAQQALQPMLDDGRCTALEVLVAKPRPGWLAMQITLTAANGAEFSFNHPVKVA